MNKKILIAIIVCLIVVIGIVAFVVQRPQQSEKIGVYWVARDDVKLISVYVQNEGNIPVNLTSVELIYLPDETLGIMWLERHTLETEGGYRQAHFKSYFTDAEGERLDFYNSLNEGKQEAIVKIKVATEKAHYTFLPERSSLLTEPTTIEEK